MHPVCKLRMRPTELAYKGNFPNDHFSGVVSIFVGFYHPVDVDLEHTLGNPKSFH